MEDTNTIQRDGGVIKNRMETNVIYFVEMARVRKPEY